MRLVNTIKTYTAYGSLYEGHDYGNCGCPFGILNQIPQIVGNMAFVLNTFPSIVKFMSASSHSQLTPVNLKVILYGYRFSLK